MREITAEDIKKAQADFAKFREERFAHARSRQLSLPVEQQQIIQVQHAAERAALSGDRLYTAQVLILAGLPVQRPLSQQPIQRSARLGDGSRINVTFAPTSTGIPLPYGSDRLMMHFLTNKAFVTKSNVFRWNCVDEFIELFQLTDHSGGSYRRVQERFIRVAYMNITVEILEPGEEGHKVTMMSAPLIDGIRFHGVEVDGEGNWTIQQSPRQMLDNINLVRVGENFFNHWLNSDEQPAIPLPMEIFRSKAIRQSARITDYSNFLYYRSFAAAHDSFIPWHMLMEGFEYQRLKEVVADFRKALAELHKLPQPFPRIRADVDSTGLYLKALPQGTEYFRGYPKKIGPPARS